MADLIQLGAFFDALLCRFMQLIQEFPATDFHRGLADWAWIGLGQLQPVMASPFGDVFFINHDSSYWFLSHLDGTISREWESRAQLQAALETPDGQDQFLLGALAFAAERGGLTLEPNEVYAFVPHPIFSGSFAVENITKLNFVAALSLAGQLHRQLQEPPAGKTSSVIN